MHVMSGTTQPSAARHSGQAGQRAGGDPRWLDDEEMAAWLPLMRLLHLLPQHLDRQLREQAGITHHYYMIMASLSAEPDRQMTLSSLGHTVGMAPSRLTHALGSLESRGWVERRPCETDRRVQYAWLTEEGMRALQQIAPGHVAEVRRRVFDALDRQDLADLRRLAGKIATSLPG